MAPIGGERSFVSALTLAAFHDMGFYKADLSLAEALPWGNGAGCAFSSDKCVSADGSVGMLSADGYFCTDAQQEACNHDLTGKAYCAVANYNADISPRIMPHRIGCSTIHGHAHRTAANTRLMVMRAAWTEKNAEVRR